MASFNLNQSTVNDANASEAEIEHLKQLNETLYNITKQYTTKYKERELELTRQFKKKEEKYTSQIEELQQDIKFYTTEMTTMTQEILNIRKSTNKSSSSQTNQFQKQLQSLNGELFNKDVIIKQLKAELNDENKICYGLRQKIASKDSEIEILKEKLLSNTNMPRQLLRPMSSTLQIPHFRSQQSDGHGLVLTKMESDTEEIPVFAGFRSDTTIKRDSATIQNFGKLREISLDLPEKISTAYSTSPIAGTSMLPNYETYMQQSEVFYHVYILGNIDVICINIAVRSYRM